MSVVEWKITVGADEVCRYNFIEIGGLDRVNRNCDVKVGQSGRSSCRYCRNLTSEIAIKAVKPVKSRSGRLVYVYRNQEFGWNK